jgi:hypothetical protein
MHIQAIRRSVIAVLLGLWVVLGAAQDAAIRFPDIDGETLTGRTLKLPSALTAPRTIVLAAYDEDQQKDIDQWVAGLEMKARNLPFLELPVLGKQNPFIQNLILTGMRRSKPDKADRERAVATFVPGEDFRRQLGLGGGGKNIHVLVVERTGAVKLRMEGAFTPEKGTQVQAALNPP